MVVPRVRSSVSQELVRIEFLCKYPIITSMRTKI